MFDDNRKIKYVIGVDEAGRGPLAGPVTVAAVLLPIRFDIKPYKTLRDSKKLTEPKRQEWMKLINNIKKENKGDFIFSMASQGSIDKFGINTCIMRAVCRCLNKLKIDPAKCVVLLDGGLKAPHKFSNQKTIIRGDESEIIIALASIVAKVKRDKLMVSLSKKFSSYGFDKHKGYGTKNHIENIKKFGASEIHRQTFLRNFNI